MLTRLPNRIYRRFTRQKTITLRLLMEKSIGLLHNAGEMLRFAGFWQISRLHQTTTNTNPICLSARIIPVNKEMITLVYTNSGTGRQPRLLNYDCEHEPLNCRSHAQCESYHIHNHCNRWWQLMVQEPTITSSTYLIQQQQQAYLESPTIAIFH